MCSVSGRLAVLSRAVTAVTRIILVTGIVLSRILLAITAFGLPILLPVLLSVLLAILLTILLSVALGHLLPIGLAVSLRDRVLLAVLAVTGLPLIVTPVRSISLILTSIPVSIIILPEGGPSHNQEDQ